MGKGEERSRKGRENLQYQPPFVFLSLLASPPIFLISLISYAFEHHYPSIHLAFPLSLPSAPPLHPLPFTTNSHPLPTQLPFPLPFLLPFTPSSLPTAGFPFPLLSLSLPHVLSFVYIPCILSLSFSSSSSPSPFTTPPFPSPTSLPPSTYLIIPFIFRASSRSS